MQIITNGGNVFVFSSLPSRFIIIRKFQYIRVLFGWLSGHFLRCSQIDIVQVSWLVGKIDFQFPNLPHDVPNEKWQRDLSFCLSTPPSHSLIFCGSLYSMGIDVNVDNPNSWSITFCGVLIQRIRELRLCPKFFSKFESAEKKRDVRMLWIIIILMERDKNASNGRAEEKTTRTPAESFPESAAERRWWWARVKRE